MTATWDVLLGDDTERAVREELERTWGQLQEGSRSSLERFDRARSGLEEPRDVLLVIWALHHALDGALVVAGTNLGLVLCAATQGSREQEARARFLAAHGARALSRAKVKAVIEHGWVAVALTGGRFLATDTREGDLRALTALLVAAARIAQTQEGERHD